MKKILSIAAAAIMAVVSLTSAVSASADDIASGDCGAKLKWVLDSDGVLTVSGTGKMYTGNWDNYDTINTDVWTYLAHAEDIKKVIIEEGVTSIGCGAFYQCQNLETVVIPSTVTDFDGRETYPSGSSGDKINYSFAECTSLKNLTLTEGMTCIGGYAFFNCTALESVTIPSTITQWGRNSFYKCTSLKDITLQEGITIMGASAFRGTAVESVVIPSTITNWPSDEHRDRALNELGGNFTGYAFRDCEKLSSVTFTEGLKSIKNGAFYNCPSLKKVFIPASVTSLNYAFAGCTGLEEVEIEKGSEMTQLSNYAFYYCENLKTLEISAGIEISYTNARWAEGCSALESIYLHDTNYQNYYFETSDSTYYYCYPDTTTYNTLCKNFSSSRVKDITEEMDEFNTVVNEAKEINEEKYTAESYAVLKVLLENAANYGDDSNILSLRTITADIKSAINALVKKPTEPSKNPSEPSKNLTNPTTADPKKTTAVTKVTRSSEAVKKDKTAAVRAMKQAKIKKLTVKSKAKKKINVSWKKVKKAKGYEVQVSTNKKFKKSKIIYDKLTSKKKIIIKNAKIKSKKTYYVRVRAYASYQDTNNTAVKVYSSWNKQLRKVKTK